MPTKMHNDLARPNDDTKNRQSTQGNQSKTKSQSNQATSKTAHKTSMKDEDVDNNTSSRSSRK
jgi:hypothetical protein